MANYVPNSWGRTRRPKDMSENVPASMQTATQVTTVAASALADDLDKARSAEVPLEKGGSAPY